VTSLIGRKNGDRRAHGGLSSEEENLEDRLYEKGESQMSKQRKRFYQDGFGNRHNSLFSPGPNFHLNAGVGKNGGPAGLTRYARGYFEAGARLVKSLQEDPLEVDWLIYPLVMVYRHGIETALKHLGKVLPALCDETAEVKLTHRLMDNWKVVRRYLEQIEVEAEEIEQVESKLTEFVQIDPNGETFRYPESRDGTRHLQDTSLINVEVFGEGMRYLSTFLEGCCDWADHLYDQKCEMADYYGRE